MSECWEIERLVLPECVSKHGVWRRRAKITYMTASTDGGRAVKQQWLWNKLRNMHGSAEAAFEALQHKELRTQYGRLRASLGELSTGSSGGGLDLMESRFLAYREGKTHHQVTQSVEAGWVLLVGVISGHTYMGVMS